MEPASTNYQIKALTKLIFSEVLKRHNQPMATMFLVFEHFGDEGVDYTPYSACCLKIFETLEHAQEFVEMYKNLELIKLREKNEEFLDYYEQHYNNIVIGHQETYFNGIYIEEVEIWSPPQQIIK